MIGIFWIIDNKIITKKVNLNEIEEINGFKDSGFCCFVECEKMGFKINACTKFPRGRIVYDIYDNRYDVLISKEIIENEKYQSIILKEFGIDDICHYYKMNISKTVKNLQDYF